MCYINIWSIHDGSERSVGRGSKSSFPVVSGPGEIHPPLQVRSARTARPVGGFAICPQCIGLPGRLVWPPIEQRWELRALCFCGFRLAALAKGTNCSFVSLMDAAWMARWVVWVGWMGCQTLQAWSFK